MSTGGQLAGVCGGWFEIARISQTQGNAQKLRTQEHLRKHKMGQKRLLTLTVVHVSEASELARRHVQHSFWCVRNWIYPVRIQMLFSFSDRSFSTTTLTWNFTKRQLLWTQS